ncbi:MAG TPA: SLC13 family permease [Steroidobacteraceae bacterium]|nr:SLC13 family permease [Steroidobacteraceae bacterium]
MSADQIVYLLIVAITLMLFISERVRIDVAAMLTLLALAVTGLLSPAQALSGFASEPAIIVASVFVISAALSATGVTEQIGAYISRAAGAREWRAILVVMPAVAALAAFSHHLMITAMMLPIMMRLAREQKLSPSRLLMPMSLAASIGTTLTIFSAPAFLLANHLLRAGDHQALGIFGITPIGAALVVLAVIYMSLGRWLLPRRLVRPNETDYLRLDRYYTELVVEENSRWIDRPLGEFNLHFENRLEVVEWMRAGVRQRNAGRQSVLHAGDVLFVRASPDEIASVEGEAGLALHAVRKYSGKPAVGKEDKDAYQLVQVVVAPHSQFVGETIAGIDFRRSMGVVVVGMWRREGWIREELSQVRLSEGDLLVLRGTSDKLSALAGHHGFLMMVPFTANPRRRQRAASAIVIVAAVVAGAASGVVPAQMAFLAGAVALVITGCVSIDQAYREIDVRIFVMIAGVIPLGLAMEQTGTAALLADQLQRVVMDWHPLAVLLSLFWAAALVTQILSDAATVVLLGPISLALAVALGLPPQPFIVCTALGAVAAFLTPIGHHGNLLILNPGQYTFGDFLRVGGPLTVGISLVSVWLAQWLWLGGPLIPDWGVLLQSLRNLLP